MARIGRIGGGKRWITVPPPQGVVLVSFLNLIERLQTMVSLSVAVCLKFTTVILPLVLTSLSDVNNLMSSGVSIRKLLLSKCIHDVYN